jgi:ABC-type transport system substrate-binding protein
MKRSLALGIIFLFALVAISGCTTPPGKDTLVVAIEEDITIPDARQTFSSYGLALQRQWGGQLVRAVPGSDIDIHPGWAETVSFNGTHYTMTIREGATFHDGSSITAEDVEYSMIANYMSYYTLFGYFAENDSDAVIAAEVDYYLGQFTYDSPDSRTFTWGGGTDIVAPTFYTDLAGGYPIYLLQPKGSFSTADKFENWSFAPVSCGPYKWSEYVADDYVLLERFDDWYGWGETFTVAGTDYTYPSKDDAFKYIRFRIIAEKAMQVVELRTGGIDLTTGRFSSNKAFESIVNDEAYDGIQVPVVGGATLSVNMQGDYPDFWGGPGNYPCNQIWFRQAISHAVNRTNIVENVYEGIADEYDQMYPDWLLNKFTTLDTSDYYDFDIDLTKAATILDANAPALGFPDEPTNRFGYGPYANETDIGGVEQNTGRHFEILTMECDFCTKRAIAVQKDLQQIGVFVDVKVLEFGDYLTQLRSGTAGRNFNTTYIGTPEGDPDYSGPSWDFSLGGWGAWYTTPAGFVRFQGITGWLYSGSYANRGWYNPDYQIGQAMINGGLPIYTYESYFAAAGITFPYPAPGGTYSYDATTGFPTPEGWTPDEAQFVEGCRLMGKAYANDLPGIPLVYYVDTFTYDAQLRNFVADRMGNYNLYYCYWE